MFTLKLSDIYFPILKASLRGTEENERGINCHFIISQTRLFVSGQTSWEINRRSAEYVDRDSDIKDLSISMFAHVQ